VRSGILRHRALWIIIDTSSPKKSQQALALPANRCVPLRKITGTAVSETAARSGDNLAKLLNAIRKIADAADQWKKAGALGALHLKSKSRGALPRVDVQRKDRHPGRSVPLLFHPDRPSNLHWMRKRKKTSVLTEWFRENEPEAAHLNVPNGSIEGNCKRFKKIRGFSIFVLLLVEILDSSPQSP